MTNKKYYKIYLENTKEKTITEIAKINSKGLAYSTLKFYQENIYTRSFDKLTIA